MSSFTAAGGGGRGSGQGGHLPPRRLEHNVPSHIKAAMGWSKDKRGRYHRCIRCWAFGTAKHLDNWRDCSGICPCCPDEDQHWGRACPVLLMNTKDEWWISHAGIPAPEWRPEPLSHAPAAPAASLGYNMRSGSGHQLGSGPSMRGGRSARSPSPTSRRAAHRSRSRSPKRERECQYRDDRAYRDRDYHRDRLPETGRTLFSEFATDRRAFPETERPTGSLPRASNGNGAAPVSSGSGYETPAIAPDTAPVPVPTALVWSNGAVTRPTVRDLLVHDECVSMMVHQSLLLSNFFDRHPEATLGERVVTNDMSRYLDAVRIYHPDYLSPTARPFATPRSTVADPRPAGNKGADKK